MELWELEPEIALAIVGGRFLLVDPHEVILLDAEQARALAEVFVLPPSVREALLAA